MPPHAASLFPERGPPQPNFPLGAGPGGGAELRGARRGPPGLSLRTRPGGRGEPREGGGGGCGAAAGALTAPAGGGAAPAEGAAPPGPRGHLLAEPGRRHPPGAATTAGLGRAATRRGPEAAAQRPWLPEPAELPPTGRRALRGLPPPLREASLPLEISQGSRLLGGQPLSLSESRAVPGPDADFRQLLAGGEELTHPRSASKRGECTAEKTMEWSELQFFTPILGAVGESYMQKRCLEWCFGERSTRDEKCKGVQALRETVVIAGA